MMGIFITILHSIILAVHAMGGIAFMAGGDVNGAVLGVATERHFPQARIVTPFTATAFPLRVITTAQRRAYAAISYQRCSCCRGY